MIGVNVVRVFFYERNVKGSFQFGQVRVFAATACNCSVQNDRCLCSG